MGDQDSIPSKVSDISLSQLVKTGSETHPKPYSEADHPCPSTGEVWMRAVLLTLPMHVLPDS